MPGKFENHGPRFKRQDDGSPGKLACCFPMVQRLAEIAPLALARPPRDEGRRPLKIRLLTGPGAL